MMCISSKQRLFALLVLSCLAIPPTVFCIGFVDVTEKAHVSGTGIGNGIAFIDYDNDGKLDLYVSSDPNDILYHNNGDGTFTDVTEKVGISFSGDGVGVAFGDYDNDGYSDLYIPVNDGSDVFFQNIQGKFFDVTRGVGIDNPARSRSAAFADFDNDGFLDIYVVNEGSPNILYKNVYGKFFRDVSQIMNVTYTGPGRCCVWGDYDNDGDQDLYITYKGALNVLFCNYGNGFTDVTKIAGVEGGGDSTGAAFVDYDNDGYLDICVGSNKKIYLYHNNHDGTFTDVSENAGLIHSGVVCTPSFGDYDNDGDLDLYLAVWRGKSLMYRNNGDGTFTDVTDESGLLRVSGNSWSAIFGDYNLDGYLDIYTSYTTRLNVLYENTGNANNWLQVKVLGSLSNRDAIGARLKLTANGITQIREISGGSGYGSQYSLIAQFGLGANTSVDMLEVTWPSGISARMKNIQSNRLIVIEEGFTAVEMPDERSQSPDMEANVPDISCLLNNYPNPFNPETWIPYQLACQSDVDIRILDSTGHLARTLKLGVKNSGYYVSKIKAAYWDGKNENGETAAGGVYFCQLKAGNVTDIKKIILRK